MAHLRIAGVGASPGLGIGRAFIYRRPDTPRATADRPAPLPVADRQKELDRLHAALDGASVALAQVRAETAARLGAAEAAVFEAQALFLQDPALLDALETAIRAEGRSAHDAIQVVFGGAAATLASLEDPALRARAADLRDVQDRLIHLLTDPSRSLIVGGIAHEHEDTSPTGPQLVGSSSPIAAGSRLSDIPENAILVAGDLTPSQVIGLPRDHVRGIVLAAGAPTAHAAILARGLGLPLVIGAGDVIQQVAMGEPLLLDGDTGIVLVAPEPAEIAAYRAQMDTQSVAVASDAPQRSPVSTADGRRIELHANASSLAEAQLALDHGAEGIGLLRTEFLLATLLDWTSLAEEALADAYEAIMRTMGNRPVTVRAMDAGGDKPLPFLDVGQEANPSLGWRGIRVLLDLPELFAGQARALLRAAARCQTTARLLLPMVSDVEEFRRARALVDAVAGDVGYAGPLLVGAMIEVPAAALLADALAIEADFFSLGTNDLAQYTLASDRGNPRMADRCRFLHPAVLRLVDMTVRAAHAAGRPVGVCGEAAGDPDAVPLLVGLGVDELSVGPARLPAVRNHLRGLSFDAAQQLAAEALRQATAQAVADLVAGR